jgi:hypothetical protein
MFNTNATINQSIDQESLPPLRKALSSFIWNPLAGELGLVGHPDNGH